jgi:hypothetical protein
MVRPFTIAAGSAECAWDMAAFCEWVHCLSGAAVRTGLSQSYAAGLDQKGIDVRWPMLLDLLGKYAATYECHGCSGLGQQLSSDTGMHIGCKLLTPNWQDRILISRSLLVQAAKQTF